MKLNHKFSFIILFTIVQAFVLTFFSVINLNNIQDIKDYQIIETKTEAQLSSIIDYLERMDYWDFDIENAYKGFTDQKKEITESFNYLMEAPVVSKFPEEFTTNLKHVKLTWGLINDDLAPIEEVLQSMESSNISSGMRTNIKNFGFRETSKLYVNNEAMDKLMEQLDEAHQHLRKIRLTYVSLMSLNQKSSAMVEEVMIATEKRFLMITIIFAVITTIILSILILIVTSRVSRRIVKVRNMTTTLAEKDFTVNIEPEGSDEMWLLMSNINNMVNQVNEFFQLVKSTAKRALNAETSINESAGSTAEASALIDSNIDSLTVWI